MDNQQLFSGIMFNNKLYQRRSSHRALCLNPNCKAPRVCEIQIKSDHRHINHRDHQACQGWIHSIDSLKKWNHGHHDMKPGAIISTDYFENPIQSIYYIEKFASIKWEDHLFSYFQQLKNSIDDELGKIYIKCQRNINSHLTINRKIFKKIEALCEDASIKMENGYDQFYKKYLEDDLRAIQRTGLLNISNNQMLKKSLSLIVEQLQNVELCIWNKEVEYDLFERMKLKSQKEDLINFDMQSNLQEINNKLQAITASFKISIKYIQEEKNTSTCCFICPKTIHSNASNNKLRKQQCRTSLLDHLLNSHIDQIVSKYSVNRPLKLSIHEVKRQIIGKNIKKVVIVDKQNMSQFDCVSMACFPDYLFIEVVSNNTESIAKCRYLVAESKGKDAADIFIIIVLNELSKLKLQEIILLTKDHYGETLKPIFAALGINITVSDTFDLQKLNQLKQNQVNSMITIQY